MDMLSAFFIIKNSVSYLVFFMFLYEAESLFFNFCNKFSCNFGMDYIKFVDCIVLFQYIFVNSCPNQ